MSQYEPSDTASCPKRSEAMSFIGMEIRDEKDVIRQADKLLNKWRYIQPKNRITVLCELFPGSPTLDQVLKNGRVQKWCMATRDLKKIIPAEKVFRTSYLTSNDLTTTKGRLNSNKRFSITTLQNH